MSGEPSAYDTLGLRPGAPRAEVDEAYRRLIKAHHPDRTGGDGSRAADINRAYTQLTRSLPAPPRPRRSVPVPVPQRRRASAGRGATFLLSLGLIAAAALVILQMPSRRSGVPAALAPLQWTSLPDPMSSGVVTPLVDFDEPLETAVIDRSIADAVQFHSSADARASMQYSRDCHDRLRDNPSLAWFDACAAFDEATLTLGSGGTSDGDAFDGPQVIAREMASARMLTDDILAADSRVHQIRSRVELTLVPMLDAAAAARP